MGYCLRKNIYQSEMEAIYNCFRHAIGFCFDRAFGCFPGACVGHIPLITRTRYLPISYWPSFSLRSAPCPLGESVMTHSELSLLNESYIRAPTATSNCPFTTYEDAQWRSQDFSYGGAHARKACHLGESGDMPPQENFGFQTF